MNASSELDEVRGIAMAAFALSVNTLRFLKEHGALDQRDVTSIVSGVLLTLEKPELVSNTSAHVARTVLSGVCADLGVPLKAPN